MSHKNSNTERRGGKTAIRVRFRQKKGEDGVGGRENNRDGDDSSDA